MELQASYFQKGSRPEGIACIGCDDSYYFGNSYAALFP
jgi:hypothetical protein